MSGLFDLSVDACNQTAQAFSYKCGAIHTYPYIPIVHTHMHSEQVFMVTNAFPVCSTPLFTTVAISIQYDNFY